MGWQTEKSWPVPLSTLPRSIVLLCLVLFKNLETGIFGSVIPVRTSLSPVAIYYSSTVFTHVEGHLTSRANHAHHRVSWSQESGDLPSASIDTLPREHKAVLVQPSSHHDWTDGKTVKAQDAFYTGFRVKLASSWKPRDWSQVVFRRFAPDRLSAILDGTPR